jgi:hypothetical protein
MPPAVAAAMLRWTTTSSNRVESCRIRYVLAFSCKGTLQFACNRVQVSPIESNRIRYVPSLLMQGHPPVPFLATPMPGSSPHRLQCPPNRYFREYILYSTTHGRKSQRPNAQGSQESRINPSLPERLARFHLAAHVERVNPFELHELSQD